MQVITTPVRGFPCSQALGAYLRVKADNTYGLGLAGTTDIELGTTMQKHVVLGLGAAESCPVVLPSAQGTIKMVASGIIAAMGDVYAGASGKVAPTGTIKIGVNVGAASGADGDIIEVLRMYTAPTADAVDLTTAQTLVTKTLTAPVINTPVIVKTNEAHTAGDTLTAAESGSTHTNTGASGAVTLVLPAATVGQEFTFVVGAVQELRIDPNTTQTIGLPSTGVQGAAGKYLVADAVGEWVTLYCAIAGTWTAKGYFGTWTAEG